MCALTGHGNLLLLSMAQPIKRTFRKAWGYNSHLLLCFFRTPVRSVLLLRASNAMGTPIQGARPPAHRATAVTGAEWLLHPLVEADLTLPIDGALLAVAQEPLVSLVAQGIWAGSQGLEY